MKKNYMHIIFVTLAILMLSIGIALLSVTALNGDEIAVTSGEYGDILIPVSSEGGWIEDELPSMGEITVGGNFGESTVMTPNATTTEVLPEGVYALKNVGNTNRWMDMEQNHVEPGKHIQQYAYASSPADTFSRAGLFKISKKSGTTNQYIIRSMLNNRLSFGFTDDNCDEVITVKIAADDDAVQDKYTFIITYSTSGYVIKPYEEDYAISAPNSLASGSASYLTGQPISSINNRARWEMQRYDGENYSGGYITSNKEIYKGLTIGTPYTLTTYGWTTLIGVNKIKLSVPSAYSDIISGTWNTSSESLPLTIKKAGQFKINQYMYDTTGSSETLVRSFYGNYIAVPPIEDGERYFIKNMGTNRYMDVEGPSTAEGAIIQQWSFSTATQKQWIFTHESGGYFTIKSAFSNKYVGVDSTNTSVIRQYGTKSDYTLWYFEGTDSGNYSLHCKASAVTGVLALPSVSSGDGANLRIYAYTDDINYRDEWMFESYPIIFYGITNSGHNHVSCLNRVVEWFVDNGAGNVLVRDGSVSSQTCKDDLLSTNIFTSRSHGTYILAPGPGLPPVDATLIALNDESGSNSVNFYSHACAGMNSSDGYMQSSEDYSNVDIALFIGCTTGYGGEGHRNLPSAIVEYGATVAIGFQDDISCDDSNDWTEKFYYQLLNGETVDEAVEYACAFAPLGSGLESVVICGNKDFVLH